MFQGKHYEKAFLQYLSVFVKYIALLKAKNLTKLHTMLIS